MDRDEKRLGWIGTWLTVAAVIVSSIVGAVGNYHARRAAEAASASVEEASEANLLAVKAGRPYLDVVSTFDLSAHPGVALTNISNTGDRAASNLSMIVGASTPGRFAWGELGTAVNDVKSRSLEATVHLTRGDELVIPKDGAALILLRLRYDDVGTGWTCEQDFFYVGDARVPPSVSVANASQRDYLESVATAYGMQPSVAGCQPAD